MAVACGVPWEVATARAACRPPALPHNSALRADC